jgi:hypothetical protein
MKKKLMSMVLLSFFLFLHSGYAKTDFGYISHSTFNIGEDIQAVAAKRFLPENSNAYLPIRNNLMKIVTHWVKKNDK